MARRTDLIDQFADLVMGADDPRRLGERTIDVVLSLVEGRCGAVFTLDGDRGDPPSGVLVRVRVLAPGWMRGSEVVIPPRVELVE